MAFDHLDWDKLLSSISANTCTPFIGAGACAGYLPTGSELAEALAEESEYPLQEGQSDLSRVAQYMAVDHRSAQFPKFALSQFFSLSHSPLAGAQFRYLQPSTKLKVADGRLARLYDRRVIPPFQEDSTALHAVLAAINSSIYLTTNYDDFMSASLRASGRDVTTDFCRWSPSLLRDYFSPFDKGYQPSNSNALVYHLHGHADTVSSCVVTEDDYLDFTAYIAQDLCRTKEGIGKKVMLPVCIRRAIKNNLLLFLGYSIRDQNLRVVLRTLWQTLSPSTDQLNIAVQLKAEPEMNGAQLDRITKYLEKQYEISLRLQVYWGDSRDFACELKKRL